MSTEQPDKPQVMPYAKPAAQRKQFTLVKSLVVAGIIVLLGTIFLPLPARLKERAHQPNCLGNLRSINNAIEMYGQSNGRPGVLPPDLARLVEKHCTSAALLYCPNAGAGVGDYVYHARASRNDYTNPKTALVACEARHFHGRTVRNVLFASGRAKQIKETEFRSLLIQPENAEFAAALEKALMAEAVKKPESP